MNNRYGFNKKFALYFTAILTMISTMTTYAADIHNTKPLELRLIMQDLSHNMQKITHAIAMEDWPQIEAIAPLIANHSQPPPAEKSRILKFAGSNMGKFKNFDLQTHNAAIKLSEVASHQNGSEVIATFAILQNSCLACHEKFRKPFNEYFYAPK